MPEPYREINHHKGEIDSADTIAENQSIDLPVNDDFPIDFNEARIILR